MLHAGVRYLQCFLTVEVNEPGLRELSSGADFLAGSGKQREKANRMLAIIMNGAFLSTLRKASAILKPFCRLITLYQSDKVFLSMGAGVFRQLKDKFKILKEQMVITEAECHYLYQMLCYRHGKAISPVHNLAALLDPRTYKFNLYDNDKNQAIDLLTNQLKVPFSQYMKWMQTTTMMININSPIIMEDITIRDGNTTPDLSAKEYWGQVITAISILI